MDKLNVAELTKEKLLELVGGDESAVAALYVLAGEILPQIDAAAAAKAMKLLEKNILGVQTAIVNLKTANALSMKKTEVEELLQVFAGDWQAKAEEAIKEVEKEAAKNAAAKTSTGKRGRPPKVKAEEAKEA